MTAINSSGFVEGSGWMQIAEGYGDKYQHAQNNYLPKPLTDERGIFRYKLAEDNKVIERTPEEMDADYMPVERQPTILDRVEAQVLYTALMTDTMIEGSGEM
ncbi:hypothetical protein [Alistipes putredinis]|uniref:hypothetical protein n=1 Tax=Alistipes putredinis TaxID=28117 RepID=UPI003AEF8AC0